MLQDNSTTVRATTKQGQPIVGIGDLRVVLTQEGNYWYAQGLEIDYVAQGDSIEVAKKNFETGLASTFHENLRIHGTIQPLLVPAPVELWKERFNPGSSTKRYAHIPIHGIRSLAQLEHALPHRLPFQAIRYLQALP